MPYNGVPAELTGKMDDCVSKLMAKGHDKSSAIAICESSIIGKELKMSDEATFKASDKPGDYLVVEDPQKPTTWHLQVRTDGKPDHHLMGGAWAALHEGYRGNKYEGPNKSEAIDKLKKMYDAEKMSVPGGKSLKEHLARAEALTVTLKQFDPDYSQAESWDVVTASAALSQLAQLAGGEADQNEPNHVAMLGKIMTALTKFINEEIDEMVNAQEEPGEAPEPDEVAGGPTMMEAKTTLKYNENHDELGRFASGGGGGGGGASGESTVYQSSNHDVNVKKLTTADNEIAYTVHHNKKQIANFGTEKDAVNHAKDIEHMLDTGWVNTGAGAWSNKPGALSKKESKPSLIDQIKSMFKQGARHNMSDQKMIQTIHDHASALGADCAMQVKQMADGAWRWVLLSSNAYRDKDKEIVSTKALEDDCLRADADGYYGPLRWWHVGEYDITTKQAGPGADLGMCDFNAMHGRILIESGTFKNEAIARAVQKAAPNLESSLGFFHPLTEPDGEGTYKSIRRFERSLLPKGKAANPLTALTVITKETQTMQKEKLEGLKALVGEAEAASIVNQAEVVQKAADAAGLSFKAQESAPAATPEPVTTDSLKEMTDTLAASLAPVIEAKVKEQVEAALKAYAVTAETKAAGQQAQIDKLTVSLKELIGDLPRNASRGVVAIDSDHNIVSDAKTKEFDPENIKSKAPLEDFANWLVTGKMAA